MAVYLFQMAATMVGPWFAYDTKMAAVIIYTLQLFILERCSIFSTTTRAENYYSFKEIGHPMLLKCGTGYRAHRFKQ